MIDISVNTNILLFIGTQAATPGKRESRKLHKPQGFGLDPVNDLEIGHMKKIIAIAAILAATQASAFWGNGYDNMYNNGYGAGNTAGNGVFDGYGDAAGEGTFSMNFSGRANTNMRGYGNGYGSGDGWGRGYNQSTPYYGAPYAYAPMAPAAPVAPAAE
jgi:hypothetical protein